MRMKIFAALGAALMLCGCIDVQQNFKFADDGTVKVAMRLGLEATLVAMIDSDENKPFCGQETVEDIEKSGIKVSTQRSTEGSSVICAFELEGPAKLVLDTLNSGELIPGEKPEGGPEMDVKLSREDDNLVFLVSIPPMGSDDADAKEEGMEQLEKMVLASMTGRTLSWSITAPNILKTTGTLSEDEKTASFSVPLTEVFTNKSKTYVFSTVFEVSNPEAFAWVETASE